MSKDLDNEVVSQAKSFQKSSGQHFIRCGIRNWLSLDELVKREEEDACHKLKAKLFHLSLSNLGLVSFLLASTEKAPVSDLQGQSYQLVQAEDLSKVGWIIDISLERK